MKTYHVFWLAQGLWFIVTELFAVLGHLRDHGWWSAD